MKNKVYLSQHSTESLHSLGLSETQTAHLVEAIDSLRDNTAPSGQIVFSDDSPGGGLRAIVTDGLQILFRYDPQNNTVFVADVSASANDRMPIPA